MTNKTFDENKNTTTRTISNTPDGCGLFRGISGNFTRFSQIAEEFIDNAVADFLAHKGEVDIPCVDIILEQKSDYVEVTVRDGGTGIADLDAALTIGGPVQVKSPLHEHSMGLKHALASVSTDEDQYWRIQTRTAEDAAANCFRAVESPYGTGTMTCEVKAGCGDVVDETGTVIQFHCPISMFETLKPKNKRVESTFEEYVGYFIEELRYVYAPLLKRGEVCFTVTATAPRYPKDAFTEEEIDLLWNRLEDDLLGNSVRLMLYTGLRVQELLALESDDIAEDGSAVSVTKAVKTVNHKASLGPPKSKSSRRKIPVPEKARACALYLRAYGMGKPRIWMPGGRNACYSVGTFRNRYYRALARVPGVRDLSPHSCRHTYVTNLQARGVSIEIIAQLSGHAKIETTVTYTHTSMETLSAAISVLDRRAG